MVVSGNGVQARGLQVLYRKVFPVVEKVFRDGDGGSRAYIVQSGSVDIVKEIDGKDVTVGTVGPGGIFGEMALIDDEPRMASAIVADTCVCIVITHAVFQKKLNDLDPFLSGVLRILVENIRSIQAAKQASQGLESMFECVDCVDEDDVPVAEAEPVVEEEDAAFEIA